MERYYPAVVSNGYSTQGVDGLDGKIGDWIKAKRRPLLIAGGVLAVAIGAYIFMSQKTKRTNSPSEAKGLSGVRGRKKPRKNERLRKKVRLK